jgi:exopolysaccharide biosynthesis polyprenyl glycosylphosphotransferase
MRERDFKFIILLGDLLVAGAWMLLMPLLLNRDHSVIFPWARPLFAWANLCVLAVIMFNLFGCYRNRWTMSLPSEIFGVIKSIAIVALILAVVRSYFMEFPLLISAPVIAIWFFFVGTVIFSLERAILYWVHRNMVRVGWIVRRSILVGAGPEAEEIRVKLRHEPDFGIRIVGQVASGDEEGDLPAHVEPFSQLRQMLLKSRVEDIVVAVPSNSKAIDGILSSCIGIPVTIRTVPDLLGIAGGQVRAWRTGGMPLVELAAGTAKHRYMRIKRIIDILSASILFVLSLPLWLILFPIVRIQTGGSLLFRQERVGQNGKHFTMLKFRSMVVEAEKGLGPVWAGENDPRIVRIGKLIRKLRVDEVPQLINVIKGDMSMIGPRPERPYFVDIFTRSLPFYSRRLSIKPGITGWSQIQNKYDESLDDVKEKLKYDLYYMDNMCLSLDIEIFFRTIWVMLIGKGAR